MRAGSDATLVASTDDSDILRKGKACTAPARRRIAPDQLEALSTLFHTKPHPSREERMMLAMDLDMEPNIVTNWFIRRRATARKHALAWGSADAKNAPTGPFKLKRTLSLDEVASRSQRRPLRPTKSALVINLFRPTLAPRHANGAHARNPNSRQPPDNDLWLGMPSSPPIPTSSPSADRTKFLKLPAKSHTRRSLEWACANARVLHTRTRRSAEHVELDDGTETEVDRHRDADWDSVTEVDEAVTPQLSLAMIPDVALSSFPPNDTHPAHDLLHWPVSNNTLKKSDHGGDQTLAMMLLGLGR